MHAKREIEKYRSPEVERLDAQVKQLRALQSGAQDAAALRGMTLEQALDYKRRHYQIKELMRELVEREVCKAADKEVPVSRKRKLRGMVQKVFKSSHPKAPEKAEIGIHEAEDLYKEIRIDNVMHNDKGEEFQLKPGAKVDVVVEADSDATMKKPE